LQSPELAIPLIRFDLRLGGGDVSHSQLQLTQVHDLAYLSCG